MKIALIRSIEVQQTTPYLTEVATTLPARGIQAKLFYSDGVCSSADFSGELEKFPSSVSAEEITEAICRWGADVAISLSIPDENTLRDAAVKQHLSKVKIPAIAHSLDVAGIFSNKWETKQTITQFGLDTPDGFLLDGDLLNNRNLLVPAYHHLIRKKCHRIGYPVLCKPLWDCLGNGIRYINSPEDLDQFLEDPYNGNVVVEKCIIGHLCSIEIIGQNGVYIVQPSIWKGLSSASPRVVFAGVMHNPCDVAAVRALQAVKTKLVELCRHMDVCGVIEVEMIYADGTFYILEINPRVSGSTSISIASSQFNTYDALIHMATGNWEEFSKTYRGRTAFALQFPFLRTKPTTTKRVHDQITLVRSSIFTINNIVRPNAIVSCDPHQIMSIPDWIDNSFDVAEMTRSAVTDLSVTSHRLWKDLVSAE